MTGTDGQRQVASRVTVSVRPDDGERDDDSGVSDWVLEGLAAPSYEQYLKRVHGGPIAVGDEWQEFVSRGCGSPRDVRLAVERVDGGEVLGPETAIDFHRRQVDVDGR